MSVLTQFFPAGGGGSGIPVELMVISGGGGGGGGNGPFPWGGFCPGGGGGSGGMFYCSSFSLQPGVTYPITVGSGGAFGSSDSGPASSGGNSCFVVPVDGGNTSICVAGGGGGGGGYCSPNPLCSNGLPGGSGGHGAADPGLSYYLTKNASGYANESLNSGGYFGSPSNPSGCGMGGGVCICGVGAHISPPSCSYICGAIFTNIYGSDACLAGGGGTTPSPASVRTPFNMPANFGYGGIGGAGSNPSGGVQCPGGNGSSGVVVVKYPTAYGAAPASPGATNCSPATPGFYTYRFTSPGSITLP